MRLTPDGNSIPVPTGPARDVIDAREDLDPALPDGLSRTDAYRAVWQTAAAAADSDATVLTPWMRLSEEEKSEVRAARRRGRLTVVDGVAAASAPVRRAA